MWKTDSYLFWLCLLRLGKQLVGERSLEMVRPCSPWEFLCGSLNLPGSLVEAGIHDHKPPFEEDASGREGQSRTLPGSDHRLCVEEYISKTLSTPQTSHLLVLPNTILSIGFRVVVPQSELPVSGGVAVPIGQWHDHLREPWAFYDSICE